MLLRVLLLLTIFQLACGKHSNNNKNPLGGATTKSSEALSISHRSLNSREIALIKTACKALESKRTNFVNKFIGKNLYFNLNDTTCDGKSGSYFNVAFKLSVFLDDILIYTLNQVDYKGSTNFPEEESDTRGIMQLYCSQLTNPNLKSGYFIGNKESKNYSIESISPDITKITLTTYTKNSADKNLFTLATQQEISIQISEQRRPDVYGIVVAKKVIKPCGNNDKKVDNQILESSFSKF